MSFLSLAVVVGCGGGAAVRDGAGDKYAWVPVRVLGVIKNTSGHDIGSELQVAYYSFKTGVPEGESTLYLEPYNETPEHPWKLLGGSADQGVSHGKP